MARVQNAATVFPTKMSRRGLDWIDDTSPIACAAGAWRSRSDCDKERRGLAFRLANQTERALLIVDAATA